MTLNRFFIHSKAEGIAVSNLFRLGYSDIRKSSYNGKSVRSLIVGKHELKGQIKILVFAIFSRSFSCRETALNRVVNGPLSLSPNDISEDVEVWIIDKKEHVYKFTRSDILGAY